MIRVFFAALFIITSLSLSADSNPTHGGEIDIKASTIKWVGKKVVGSHEGTIALKSGKLNFANHKLTGGNFTIDMTTIKCTDLSGKKADNLAGHLSNEDFFEVDKYPTSELVIKKVEALATADTYKIIADLTIKGITKNIEFDADVKAKSASAVINVDRTAYDIKYGSGSFFDNLGDRAIDNNFSLSVNLVIK